MACWGLLIVYQSKYQSLILQADFKDWESSFMLWMLEVSPWTMKLLNIALSWGVKLLYWGDSSCINKRTVCRSNQFLLEKLWFNCLPIYFSWILLVFIMRQMSLTTLNLKIPILSPSCSSNLGINIYTFSSFSILFSIFWRRVSLLLQFFWIKIWSISFICISQAEGSLGKSLFLNSVSELSMR